MTSSKSTTPHVYDKSRRRNQKAPGASRGLRDGAGVQSYLDEALVRHVLGPLGDDGGRRSDVDVGRARELGEARHVRVAVVPAGRLRPHDHADVGRRREDPGRVLVRPVDLRLGVAVDVALQDLGGAVVRLDRGRGVPELRAVCGDLALIRRGGGGQGRRGLLVSRVSIASV